MDIGTGIALAGIWVFAGMSWASASVYNMGRWIALIIALGMSFYLTM